MHMFFQCFSMVLAFSGGAAREDQDVHFIFKAFFVANVNDNLKSWTVNWTFDNMLGTFHSDAYLSCFFFNQSPLPDVT